MAQAQTTRGSSPRCAPSNIRARTTRCRSTIPATGELTAVVSDEQFAGDPLNVGDNVSVLWADKDIHALAPAS